MHAIRNRWTLATAGRLATVTLIFAGAAPALASDPLAAGSRVRVLAPGVSAKPIVGDLVGSDDATLIVRRTEGVLLRPGWPFHRRRGVTVRLPRASVTRFDYRVRPGRKRLGALVGALIGVTTAVAVIERSRAGADTGCTGCGLVLAAAATPCALLGAAVAPGDRWAAQDVAKVRVTFVPAAGAGLGVRVSLTF